ADQTSTDIDPLDLLVQSLAMEHDENRLLLDALTPSLKEQQDQAQTVAKFLVEEEETRTEVNRLRQAFDNISDRLRQINLTREAGGFDARVITPAAAGIKVAPQLLMYAALALIGGLAAGLGLAYLADFADKS